MQYPVPALAQTQDLKNVFAIVWHIIGAILQVAVAIKTEVHMQGRRTDTSYGSTNSAAENSYTKTSF